MTEQTGPANSFIKIMIVPDSMGKMRVAGKKGMGHSAKSGKQKAEAVDQIPMGVNLYCWGIRTTSGAGGMRMAPGRGRGHLCWWPLI